MKNEQDPRELIDRVIEKSVEKYDSYAYAAGFLGSMLAVMIEGLPKNQRAEAIKMLESAQ